MTINPVEKSGRKERGDREKGRREGERRDGGIWWRERGMSARVIWKAIPINMDMLG